MKKVLYAAFFLAGTVYLTACNGDVEKRVVDLERRVAALEGGGISKATPSITPNKTPLANAAAQQASAEKPEGPLPILAFQQTEHDFGNITEGDVVTKKFTFTNNGEAPLIISNASASCGCTIPTYPKGKPIAPGETGEIEVKYNSRGKKNQDNKTVTITANTWPTVTKINIKAFVEAKPEATTAGPVKQ
ncbi:MAG: hypothetical protein ACJAT1_001700 [Marivirga sp.]|jgi:hypothetical protein